MKNTIFIALSLLAVALQGNGCTPSLTASFRPVEPVPMMWSPGATTGRTIGLAVIDDRPAAERKFHVGEFQVEPVGMGDEIDYLRTNLEQVFQSYGADVQRAETSSADLVLRVRRFQIRNQEGAFTGYHTFTTFRGDLSASGKTFPVTAYFKATRIPHENYEVVLRPCYQVPINAAVQEIAAKINRLVLGRHVADSALQKLIDEVPIQRISIADAGIRNVLENRYTTSEEFFKILRLGYSNNRKAVPAVVALADRREVLMRAAAISSIGTFGATEQFGHLQKIYARDRDLGRVMALKAIGDLDIPESHAFLGDIRRSKSYASDVMVREVVDLYD